MVRRLFPILLALVLVLASAPAFTVSAEGTMPMIEWYIGVDEKSDQSVVNDYINEYLAEKIGVQVHLNFWSGEEKWGKMTTMISAGQDVGIIGFGSQTKLDYVIQSQRGGYYPLEDMLNTIGAETKALFDDAIWEGMTINGHIYGIPTLKDNGYFISLIYNETMLEDLGLNIDDYDFSNYRELEELGYKVKELRDASEKYAEFKDYPVFGDAASLIRPYNFAFETFLNDSFLAVCEIEGIDELADYDSQTIANFYDTPEFLEFCLQKQRMVADGIFDYDYTDKTERNYTGGIFGWTGWGYTYMEEHMYGDAFKTNMKMFDTLWTDTNNFFSAGTAISANCATPEDAMKVLNLVNTDSFFATTMRFGIEGEHYMIGEDGKMTFEGSENAVPADRTYYYWYMAPVGNLTIVNAPEQLIGPDGIMLTRMIEYNNACLKGSHMGFSFDTAPVANEIAACTNIVLEYQVGLVSGQVESQEEVEAIVEEFRAKLAANGADKIVAEVQAQIEAWQAAK